MNEALSPGTRAAPGAPTGPGAPTADAFDLVLDHLKELFRDLSSGVPDWVAAEMTLGQLRLLFHLSRQGPMSMSLIGEWLSTGLPSVTGTIERLERHGLVERRHRTDDRRIVEAQLTDQGRELVVDILGIRMETARRLFGVLDASELRDLDRLLSLIIERTRGTGA